MDSAGVAELYSWRKGAIDLAVCASLWFISNADEAKRRCMWNNATYIDRRPNRRVFDVHQINPNTEQNKERNPPFVTLPNSTEDIHCRIMLSLAVNVASLAGWSLGR